MEKCSPTEAMKRLKRIVEEINEIHEKDEKESSVKTHQVLENGQYVNQPYYEGTYDLVRNRARIKELFEEERKIKMALAQFNNETKVEDYDCTLAEALVMLAQLKSEIKVLTNMAKRSEYFITETYRDDGPLNKCLYNPNDAKIYLDEARRKYTRLQYLIDKINLTSNIEY